MKSRFVTPKYNSVITAVILTANDVVATVLILDVDEEGCSIINVAEVDLPFEARNYRANNPEGKSMFQRGDVIKIRCEVSKENEIFSDENIKNMLTSLFGMEDENAELFDRINEDAKKFTTEWADLCKRDLAKEREEG